MELSDKIELDFGVSGGVSLPDIAFKGMFENTLPADFGSVNRPSQQVIKFDDPDNPTDDDKAKLLQSPVCDHFELINGKIRPKFVPIRDKIKPPQGRTDYGWNEDMKVKHLTAAYARGWPQFPYGMRPHDGVLHIVGGGPSLKKCLPQLRRAARQKKNFVLAVNKTHDFLWNLPKLGLGQAIPVWGAALLDPCDWVKDYITPRPGVQYLIGDQCAPATFDVFEKPNITRYVWRATHPRKDHGIPPKHMVFVTGGSTVGMRCRTLGYLMGFRHIHFWGFDSSVEITPERPEGAMHGYHKVESAPDRIVVKAMDENGFEQEFTTNSHMARQAQEWLELRQEWIAEVKKGRVQWVYETFHGDGLLPTLAARCGVHADPKRNVAFNETLIPGDTAITHDRQNQESPHAA